jgi:hypothetical protein
MLSQHTTYTAYIVFRVDDGCSGLHYPCQETSVSIGGRKFTQNVCLGGHDVRISWLLVMRGDIPDDSKFPKKRDDGWMELEMGEFHNGEGDDGEVSISLKEMSVVKSGLVILGIEIRPKGLLSTSIARKRPAVWLAFHAPCNLPPLADGEVSTPLMSKKALFLRLLDGPVLLADSLTVWDFAFVLVSISFIVYACSRQSWDNRLNTDPCGVCRACGLTRIPAACATCCPRGS